VPPTGFEGRADSLGQNNFGKEINTMSKLDVVRAWRDAEYRASLAESQRALLPDNPAGALNLSDLDLESVAGGTASTGPIWGTFIWNACPTGDFVPCQTQYLCPLTFGRDICPIIY